MIRTLSILLFISFNFSQSFAQSFVQPFTQPFTQPFDSNLDSQSQKACFCETGAWPDSQKLMFQMGCEIWLARQPACNQKKVVLEDTNYLNINLTKSTRAVTIGYVGHWDNSKHFVDYLSASILPFMHTTGISVFVDNTACDAMNDPESVSVFLNQQKFLKSQSLVARGNQATSIGTWDVILPSSENFTAEVSSQLDHVIYPSCDDYETRACFESYQKGEKGICIKTNNENTELTCCKTKNAAFSWEKAQNCVPVSAP